MRAATVVVMLVATAGALVVSAARGAPLLHGAALLWALGSACAEGLYVVGLARSLELAPLGLAYSVSRGTGLLWVWPLAVVFQHEPVTVVGAVASLVVLAGVVTAGTGRGELQLRPDSMRARLESPAGTPDRLRPDSMRARLESPAGTPHRLRPGAGWALLAGVGGGFSNPCIRQALVEGADPLQVFAFSLGLGLIPAVVTLKVGAGPLGRLLVARWKTVGLAGVLCFGSYALFLVALQSEGAALGTTLRNSSIAFALLLSWAAGEPPTRRQWAGGAAVMGGAALLAFRL